MEELFELWVLAWAVTIVGGIVLLGIAALGSLGRHRRQKVK